MNQNKWTDMTMELTAHQNFELLQTRVREARKHRDAAIRHQQAQDGEERQRRHEMEQFEKEQHKREQRERERKSKRHRETDLEWDRCHRRLDKEHQSQVRVAKTKAEKLPPRIKPEEKTLTVKMPQSTGLTELLPLQCQAPSSDGSSSSKQPTPSSSALASSDAQTPSPTNMPKDAGELDEFNKLDDVDPLEEMQKHYIPDQTVPSALPEEAYNPRHIENMEADYKGQHSSWEERHSGQYGGPQSYHIVPSPPHTNLEDEEELSSPVAGADASPSTVARLLAESPQPETLQGKSAQPPRPSMPVPPGGLLADEFEDHETTDF